MKIIKSSMQNYYYLSHNWLSLLEQMPLSDQIYSQFKEIIYNIIYKKEKATFQNTATLAGAVYYIMSIYGNHKLDQTILDYIKNYDNIITRYVMYDSTITEEKEYFDANKYIIAASLLN